MPLPVTTAEPVGLARSIVSGTASGLWPVALGSIAVCPGLSTCCLSSSWATRKLAARITNREVRAILALAKEAVIVDDLAGEFANDLRRKTETKTGKVVAPDEELARAHAARLVSGSLLCC